MGKTEVDPVMDDGRLVQTNQNNTVDVKFGEGRTQLEGTNGKPSSSKGKNGNPSEPKSRKGKPHSGLEGSDSHGENQDGGSSIEGEADGKGNIFGGDGEEGPPRSSSSPQLVSASSTTDRSFLDTKEKKTTGRGLIPE